MKQFLAGLKKWWWLVAIVATILGWAYGLVTDKINIERDIRDLKEKMVEQQKKQMTEKDVIILIQLLKEDSKENLNYLNRILEGR